MASGRDGRAGRRDDRAARCGRDAPARNGVRRRALRRPGTHERRPEGGRVQRPLRRPRDAGTADPARITPERPAALGGPRRGPDGAAVTVVIAAAGYPGAPHTGDPIRGAEQQGVIHAGTRRREDGVIVSSGGRVVAVTATGATLAEARERAYALAATVHLPGGQLRSDIALRAVQDAG